MFGPSFFRVWKASLSCWINYHRCWILICCQTWIELTGKKSMRIFNFTIFFFNLPDRIGYLPVIKAARLGVQRAAAATWWVNLAPSEQRLWNIHWKLRFYEIFDSYLYWGNSLINVWSWYCFVPETTNVTNSQVVDHENNNVWIWRCSVRNGKNQNQTRNLHLSAIQVKLPANFKTMQVKRRAGSGKNTFSGVSCRNPS